MVGGTGVFSFILEHHINDESVRIKLGLLDFELYSLAVSVNRYANIGDVHPYAGIGVLELIFASNLKIVTSHHLNVPKNVHPYIGFGVLNVNNIFQGEILAQYLYAPIGLDVRYGDGNPCVLPSQGWRVLGV
ncbi:hypothetical protein ACFL2X_03130 [Candidatus Latescibacterota bacterium]